ncbi:hypothetical protein ANO11243_065200 [Dothideomycetidae sp. 11243]|nr:hypothetical protein ANO11243_065200 [fungal sp. No.11243]
MVVKELIDNAIDAEATSITIEISSDTLDVIQVRDDGKGIAPRDRPLLAKPHCTSKITDEDDLAHIGGRSLGFRGEALSHAVELSDRVIITTRLDGETVGTVMTYNADGSFRDDRRQSHGLGTTVRLERFLISHPVRRRLVFNDKVKTIKRLHKLCQRYAFARDGLRLSFSVLKSTKASERWVLTAKQSDTLSDIATKVVGNIVASQCQLLEAGSDQVVISALLPKAGADLTALTSPGVGEFLSVDGRPLASSKSFGKMVLKALTCHPGWCKSVSTGTKSIFFCLRIVFLSSLYDVNIEPAKDDLLLEDPAYFLSVLDCLISKAYPLTSTSLRCDELLTDHADEQGRETGAEEIRTSQKMLASTILQDTDPNASGERRSSPSLTASAQRLKSVERADIEACNPWIMAKVNSILSPTKNTSSTTGPSRKVPPTGLITPESSPFRGAHLSSPRNPVDVVPVDSSIDHGTASNARPLIRHYASPRPAPAPSTETSLLSSHPDMMRPFRKPANVSSISSPKTSWPIRSPKKGDPKKPFRPPQLARLDRERDAWFDIPEMLKDERARKKMKRIEEASPRASSPRPPADVEMLSREQSINTDIRSFMRPRGASHAAREAQNTSIVPIDVPMGSSLRSSKPSILEDKNTVEEPSQPPQRAIRQGRSPLAEPEEFKIRVIEQPEAFVKRVKSNKTSRTKSSMLALERTPASFQIQNLLQLYHSTRLKTVQSQIYETSIFDGEGSSSNGSLSERLLEGSVDAMIERVRPMVQRLTGLDEELWQGI